MNLNPFHTSVNLHQYISRALDENDYSKRATTYGLNSFSYFSAKQWNASPGFFRTSFFADFKTKIQDVTFM